MLTLFYVTADKLKEIFDHILLFSMSEKYPVLDQNLSKIIKTSKSMKVVTSMLQIAPGMQKPKNSPDTNTF